MPFDVMRPDNLVGTSAKDWVREYRQLSGVTRDLYSGTVLRANPDGTVTHALPGERPFFGVCYGFYRRDADGCHVLLQGTVTRNAVKFADGSAVDDAAVLALRAIGIFCQDSLTA